MIRILDGFGKEKQMYCISISHKRAPLAVRNKITFTDSEIRAFSKQYYDKKAVSGIVLVSTCNRFEFYVSGLGKNYHRLMEGLLSFKGLQEEGFAEYFLVYEGERAIRHLHKVASGLDSMVVGEDEILGQLKDAYIAAHDAGYTDYEMNRAFQSAFACAKKIKTETEISKVAVSVASLTAKKIKEQYPDGADVLILGITGKTGSIVCKDLLYKSGDKYKVTGTTRQHGQTGMSVPAGVRMADYQDRYTYMGDADVIVSATRSPHYTVTYHAFGKVWDKLPGKGRKKMFIDLAVPNDIEEQIGSMEGVVLYNIDYFNELAEANNEHKLTQAEKAESYIAEYTDELMKVFAFHAFLPEFEKLGTTGEGRYMQRQIYKWKAALTYEEFMTTLKAVRITMQDSGKRKQMT